MFKLRMRTYGKWVVLAGTYSTAEDAEWFADRIRVKGQTVEVVAAQ